MNTSTISGIQYTQIICLICCIRNFKFNDGKRLIMLA